ncbi:MAG: DUF1330 domain-containing protein [Pseudomonadota bacterium]
MPKGYWIAHVEADDVSNFQSEAYKAYVSSAAPVFEQYGGRFLARGGEFETAEGNGLGSRHVLIEFPSLEDAKACYHSAVYREAKLNRQAVATANIVLVEGFE